MCSCPGFASDRMPRTSPDALYDTSEHQWGTSSSIKDLRSENNESSQLLGRPSGDRFRGKVIRGHRMLFKLFPLLGGCRPQGLPPHKTPAEELGEAAPQPEGLGGESLPRRGGWSGGRQPPKAL